MIKNKFQKFSYSINTITYVNIYLFVNKFYLDIICECKNKSNKLCIFFKLKTMNNISLDISPLLIEDKSNTNWLIDILIYYWKNWAYKNNNLNIKEITILYKHINLDIKSVNSVFKIYKNFQIEDILPEEFINLPSNISFESWGDELTINSNNTYIIAKNNGYLYYIIKLDNEYFVWIKNNNKIQYFYDTYDPYNNLNDTFIRHINNNVLYYNNNIYYIV